MEQLMSPDKSPMSVSSSWLCQGPGGAHRWWGEKNTSDETNSCVLSNAQQSKKKKKQNKGNFKEIVVHVVHVVSQDLCDKATAVGAKGAFGLYIKTYYCSL